MDVHLQINERILSDVQITSVMLGNRGITSPYSKDLLRQELQNEKKDKHLFSHLWIRQAILGFSLLKRKSRMTPWRLRCEKDAQYNSLTRFKADAEQKIGILTKNLERRHTPRIIGRRLRGQSNHKESGRCRSRNSVSKRNVWVTRSSARSSSSTRRDPSRNSPQNDLTSRAIIRQISRIDQRCVRYHKQQTKWSSWENNWSVVVSPVSSWTIEKRKKYWINYSSTQNDAHKSTDINTKETMKSQCNIKAFKLWKFSEKYSASTAYDTCLQNKYTMTVEEHIVTPTNLHSSNSSHEDVIRVVIKLFIYFEKEFWAWFSLFVKTQAKK